MPDKILGLDFGSQTLKAVLVTQGMRTGFRVELAEIIDISDAGGLAAAVAALQEKVDFRHVQVNLSLPADSVSFHNVKLPFREEKKIRQTIAFELETMLPQGIEECLYDYNIISQSQHSEMLAAVVPRTVVQERLALFGENPPPIGTIGVNALAVASLLLAGRTLSGSGLLLDIGARRTAAVFIQQGKIVQVRHYAFGGDAGSGGLQDGQENGSPGDAAVAAPLPGADSPDKGDGAIDEVCRRFCQDLANTLEFLKWGGSMEEGLTRIILTGGGSLRGGFKEEVARYFSLPVETVDVAALEGVQLSDGLRETWQPALMNQALALAVDKYKKGQGFNFPLSELEAKAHRAQFWPSLKWTVPVFAVAVLLLAVDGYLNYRFDRLRLDNLKKEINEIFKGAAPEITRVVDPVQQLKVKIAEGKKISAGLGVLDGRPTVLNLLKDISLLSPPDTEFLIGDFNLDGDKLIIKGMAKNFEAVETLKKELVKSKLLTTVEVGATSLLKQGDKVEFDLRITTQK